HVLCPPLPHTYPPSPLSTLHDPPPTQLYPLSLHDALPISGRARHIVVQAFEPVLVLAPHQIRQGQAHITPHQVNRPEAGGHAPEIGRASCRGRVESRWVGAAVQANGP